MSAPLVFLDTETTGLHADRRPWEIAMIRRANGDEATLLLQVADVDLSNAEPMGLRVGRFYERHWLFAGDSPLVPPYAEVVDENKAAALVEQWTRGAHIVGAVPNFDTECLAAMLRRHTLAPSWHYHLIDVEALAIGYLHGRIDEAGMHHPDVEPTRWTNALGLPWRSDDLSRACGVEPPGDDDRHTAMGDARWAMRLYDAITGGAS